MNIELIESLKKIASNNEILKQIENSDCSLRDIYDLFKEHGFTGSYDVFEKDYEELFNSLISEIHEDELSSVSGGKLNRFFSKSTATLLSALTLSTAAIPMSSAEKYNGSNSSSKIVNFVKKNPGKSLAILATAIVVPIGVTAASIAGYKHFSTKKIVINDKYTQQIENYYKNIKLEVDDQEYPVYEKIEENFDNHFKSKNTKEILITYINEFKNNINRKDILDYIILANSGRTSLTEISNQKIIEIYTKRIDSLKSSKNLDEEIKKATDALQNAASGFSEEKKQVYDKITNGKWLEHEELKKIVTDLGKTMDVEKVAMYTSEILQELGYIENLKFKKSKNIPKENAISEYTEALKDLPSKDFFDSASFISLFFYILKQDVKPDQRIAICNSLENKLSANKNKNISFDDLVKITTEAFAENKIDLVL